MGQTLLYGGTFDPIHFGHLITCQRAREMVGADRVMFVPARVSPHKAEGVMGATGEERMRMIELAIGGSGEAKGKGEFVVDGRELVRAGPSYTVDTVEELRGEFPGEVFTLLVGTDQLPKLHLWHRAEEILRMPVAVMRRSNGEGEAAVRAGLEAIGRRFGEEVLRRLEGRMLETPRVDISATEIRERVRRGLSIDYLAPAAVGEFIREKGLYRG